jgi:hypothetical protein
MVGVVGSNPIAPTNSSENRLVMGDWMRTKFDKIAGRDFERAQHGLEGEGQDEVHGGTSVTEGRMPGVTAQSNPIAPTN